MGSPVPLSPNSVPLTPATGSQLSCLLATGVVRLVRKSATSSQKNADELGRGCRVRREVSAQAGQAATPNQCPQET